MEVGLFHQKKSPYLFKLDSGYYHRPGSIPRKTVKKYPTKDRAMKKSREIGKRPL
jgi:hypothetical protein